MLLPWGNTSTNPHELLEPFKEFDNEPMNPTKCQFICMFLGALADIIEPTVAQASIVDDDTDSMPMVHAPA